MPRALNASFFGEIQETWSMCDVNRAIPAVSSISLRTGKSLMTSAGSSEERAAANLDTAWLAEYSSGKTTGLCLL